MGKFITGWTYCDDEVEVERYQRQLLRLYIAFRRSEGRELPKRFKTFTPDRSLIRFLLFSDKAPGIDAIGMATVSTRWDGTGTARIGTVEDVFVLPEHRGQGYCTWLMETVIEKARELKFLRLELTSNPNKSGRAVAMHVYEKLGFKLENPQAGGTNFYRLEL